MFRLAEIKQTLPRNLPIHPRVDCLELKWRRPELVSENGQFLLWKRTVFTLEKKLEVLKELDKGLSQRLVGERRKMVRKQSVKGK